MVPLRGYENASTEGGSSTDITPIGGGTIYSRYAAELRYPISMNQTAKIFALTFCRSRKHFWNNYSSFNPFQLKRSVGVGIRVYMGAFGLIGFDLLMDLIKLLVAQNLQDGRLTS